MVGYPGKAGKRAGRVSSSSWSAAHADTADCFVADFSWRAAAAAPNHVWQGSQAVAGRRFTALKKLFRRLGVAAPPLTPPKIVQAIADMINKSLSRPEVRQRFAALDLKPLGLSPSETRLRKLPVDISALKQPV